MSVPIGKYKPIFEILQTRWGRGSPVIPKYSLDMTIAGLILTERKGSFSKKELYVKMGEMGYDVNTHHGVFSQYFRNIEEAGIFLRNNRRYKFDRRILRQKNISPNPASS